MTVTDLIAAPAWDAAAGFAVLGALAQDVSGARLVTVMTFDATAREACRTWTSDPENYPSAGTKPVTETAWTRTVLDGLGTFVTNDADGIREVFFDHELIASLGCESCMNLPFVAGGRVLGTANMLDAAGYFTPVRVTAITEALTLPGTAIFLADTVFTKGSAA